MIPATRKVSTEYRNTRDAMEGGLEMNWAVAQAT